MANVWPATQSQLYGELNKLADAGLIEVTEVGARGRKEYRVTEAGRSELVRWITDTADDPPYRSAPLLRVFLLGEVPADQARNYLRGLADHADGKLAEFVALRDAVNWDACSDGDFFGRLALEYGIRTASMEAEWARWATDQIDARRD